MKIPGDAIEEVPKERDDSEQWLLTGDLPCLGDGYNLHGLVGPIVKCPECGHLNDLRDPSPWEKQDLPLGVRKREHWPASAVLYSLLVPIAFFFAGYLIILLAYLGLLAGAILVLGAIFVWGNHCQKFIRSARSSRWAIVILVGTHLGAGFVVVGIISIALLVESLSTVYQSAVSTRVAVGMVLLLPIGLGIFAWLKLQLIRHDNATAFRVDWQSYRVPVGNVVPENPQKSEDLALRY